MNKTYEFNPQIYQVVASNIKKYMALKGISIQELCEDADLKEYFLTKMLNSNENIAISIYDLYKISNVLDVSIDKFFNE